MPSYRVRQAVFKDEVAWLEMARSLWSDATSVELKEDFNRIFFSEEEAIFLCEEKDVLLGMVILSLRHEHVEGTHTTPVGYIEGIFVREEYRARKVGQCLVERSEKWAKQQGCREIASDTETSNINSQKFHQAVGFQEANRIVCYRKTLK